MNIPPTILAYGTPPDQTFFSSLIEKTGWGLALDNGRARDPIFTIYENLARADALVCFPDAHPLHLVTVMAEAEVGHPLITAERSADGSVLRSKPIVFFGDESYWQPFRDIFTLMRSQGLTRDAFDRIAHYTNNLDDAHAYIAANLPTHIPSTRLHYYVHTKREADTENRVRHDVRPPSSVTVACFGSASTKSTDHLQRAEAVARGLVRQDFNILHGGGAYGVMGELTKAGNRLKGFVKGVTVDAIGAPKIFFERATGDHIPEEVDHYIASKDMLHRIESYAGNSQAFVSLDGGVGSTQEILVIAELRLEQHPVVTFTTADDRRMLKPLWLLNESGIYGPLINYLERRGLSGLRAEIKVANSIAELELGLREFFAAHKPKPESADEAGKFRTRYGDMPHPTLPLRPGNAPR